MVKEKRTDKGQKGGQKDHSVDSYLSLRDLLEKRGYDTPYEFGRALYKYTDCGPWTSFLLPDMPDGGVYYGSARARQTDWLDRCTGIGIGSIVEGSEVELGPAVLTFPFTSQALEEAVAAIDREADFYWKRDHSIYFTVLDQDREELFSAQWTESDTAPTGDSDEDQADLALRAGEVLVNLSSIIPDEVLPIPGTTCFVRRDKTPDIIY